MGVCARANNRGETLFSASERSRYSKLSGRYNNVGMIVLVALSSIFEDYLHIGAHWCMLVGTMSVCVIDDNLATLPLWPLLAVT